MVMLFPATKTQLKKIEMVDKARISIGLCLSDKILKKLAKEKNVAYIWTKVESLYMTKSLAHNQTLKQQLYSFKMVNSKSIVEQLTEFTKILDVLVNIEMKLRMKTRLYSYCVHYIDSLITLSILCFMIKKTLSPMVRSS